MADNRIILELSPDLLEAYITVRKFPTDTVVSKEDVEAALKKGNVIYGVLEEAVRSVAAPENWGSPILVAMGTPEVNGKDGVVHYKYKADDTGGVPKQLSDGRMDYFNSIVIHCVAEGDILAVIEDAVPGQPGITVTGEVIPAREGKAIHIKPGKNVKLRDNDHEVVAAAAGHVILQGNTLNVTQVYRIDGDVDLNTGNIMFNGSVVITGNICEGFRVLADGNVEVMNIISGGSVECSGELRVKNGIVGKNKSVIKAGGSVITRFIESSNVESGKDVAASEGIMHSKVSASNNVTVSGKGVIVGGTVRAGKEISCKIAGSNLATATELEAGINPGLRKEHHRLLKEIQTREADYLKSCQILNYLRNIHHDKGELSQEQADILIRVNKSQGSLSHEIEELKGTLQRTEALVLRSEHGKINVEDIIHPGVRITIGSDVLFIRDDYRFVSFTKGEEGIKISPLK